MTTATPHLVGVVDAVLPDPVAYRRMVLAQPFADVQVGADLFRGIAVLEDRTLPTWLEQRYPTWRAGLSFARRSPAWQAEPNYIHTDAMMGDWTAILYLNPDPPVGDGTIFWRHRARGDVASREDGLAEEWRDTEAFEPWHRVEAVFNRLVVFGSPLYHSRALPENYGASEDARLIQVVFGEAA